MSQNEFIRSEINSANAKGKPLVAGQSLPNKQEAPEQHDTPKEQLPEQQLPEQQHADASADAAEQPSTKEAAPVGTQRIYNLVRCEYQFISGFSFAMFISRYWPCRKQPVGQLRATSLSLSFSSVRICQH